MWLWCGLLFEVQVNQTHMDNTEEEKRVGTWHCTLKSTQADTHVTPDVPRSVLSRLQDSRHLFEALLPQT